MLPACLVLDWFMRTIYEYYPHLLVQECQQFKVLKGIPLTSFKKESALFKVQCEEIASQEKIKTLRLKLFDSAERVCYSAEFLIGESLVEATQMKRINLSDSDGKTWPWKIAEIYPRKNQQGILFHGAAFEAITQLANYSEKQGE